MSGTVNDEQENHEVRGFDDNLYAGVMGEPNDLFPAGTKPTTDAVKEIVDARKQTQAAFMPAAKIIEGVIANAKIKAFDLSGVIKSLPEPAKRTDGMVTDELRARELYTTFLDGFEKTVLAALKEGGQHEG